MMARDRFRAKPTVGIDAHRAGAYIADPCGSCFYV